MRVGVRCSNENYKRRRSSVIPCIWLFLISAVTPNALAQDVSDTASNSSYTDSAEIEYPSGGGGTIDPPPKRSDHATTSEGRAIDLLGRESDGVSLGAERTQVAPVPPADSFRSFWSLGGGETSGRERWEYPAGGGGTIGGGAGGGGAGGGSSIGGSIAVP